jgi:hypothetical protein
MSKSTKSHKRILPGQRWVKVRNALTGNVARCTPAHRPPIRWTAQMAKRVQIDTMLGKASKWAKEQLEKHSAFLALMASRRKEWEASHD